MVLAKTVGKKWCRSSSCKISGDGIQGKMDILSGSTLCQSCHKELTIVWFAVAVSRRESTAAFRVLKLL